MEVVSLIILRTLFVDFVFGDNSTSKEYACEKIVEKFKVKYHSKIREFIMSLWTQDTNTLGEELVPGVEFSIYRAYKRAFFGLSCNITQSHKLLQVFADETIRNEITRKVFSYV